MKDPDNVPAYIRIARIYMHSNPAAVIERLRELEARDSGNPLVLQYLARACFTAGQYADAIALYERLYDPAAPTSTSSPTTPHRSSSPTATTARRS